MVNQMHTFFLHFYVTIALLLIKHRPRTLFWTVLWNKLPAVPYFNFSKEPNPQLYLTLAFSKKQIAKCDLFLPFQCNKSTAIPCFGLFNGSNCHSYIISQF